MPFRLPHDDAKAWLKTQGWDERRASMGAITLMGDGLMRVREIHERRYRMRLKHHAESLRTTGPDRPSTGYSPGQLQLLLDRWKAVAAVGDDCRRLKDRKVIAEVLDAIADEADV